MSIAVRAMLFFVLATVLPTNVHSSDDNGKKIAAITAAEHWLSLVDEGSYTDSWDNAGESLKSSTTRDAWVQVLHQDRAPEGAPISRKLNHAAYRVHKGNREFVEIWYDTSFRNRKSAIERVYTTLQPDGTWRVTGYVITADRPAPADIGMAMLLCAIVIGVLLMEVKSDQRFSLRRRNSLLPGQKRHER
jgi:hypothetical protein